MMKNIKLRKVFAIVAIAAMAFVSMPVNTIKATVCALQLSGPSSKVVEEGGSVSFKLTFSGDVADISLRDSSVALVGFTAKKTFSGTGNVRTLTLSNIKGTGSGKYIKVAGGIALSKTGNGSNPVNSSMFTVNPSDSEAPKLTISNPQPSKVYLGGTVTYVLKFTDNVGVVDISARKSCISLVGFTADVKISGTGNAQRTVTLSNIQGTIGGNKYIKVAGGVALDAKGNGSNAANSSAFTIAQRDDEPPVLKITGPDNQKVYAGGTVTYVLNFTDNIGVVDISARNSCISLVGFTADIKISGTGNAQRTVTLSNIQGTVGGNKYIKVAGGVALDAMGNGSNPADSNPFEIIEKAKEPDKTPDNPTPDDPTPDDPKPVDPKPEKPSDWRENPNTGVNI